MVCHERKVKYDRGHPCSNCARNNVECIYRVPPAPRRHKKGAGNDEDLLAELHRYEEKLRELGVPLGDGDDSDEHSSPAKKKIRLESETTQCETKTPKEKMRLGAFMNPDPSQTDDGVFLIDSAGKSRYIENTLLAALSRQIDRKIGSTSNAMLSDLPENTSDGGSSALPDSNSAMLFGPIDTRDPVDSFPRKDHVMILWKFFLTNVDPLTKMIHPPTVEKLVAQACHNIQSISKAHLALVFSLLLCSAESISESECRTLLGYDRKSVVKELRCATQRCLRKCGILRTHDIAALTAFVYYLVSATHESYIPLYSLGLACDKFKTVAQTMWSLSAIAIRTSQRIGIHKENLPNLKPFERELRNRLWKQVLFNKMACSEAAGSIAFHFVDYYWTSSSMPRNLGGGIWCSIHPFDDSRSV